MGLDRGRRSANRCGLDAVGIDRSLGQEARVAEGFGLLLEHLDEGLSNDSAFTLGILDTGQSS